MLKLALLALALVVATSGCSFDPCSSRETRAAWVAGGGPVGLVAVLALNCERPEQPQQIAMVQTAGLTEQPMPDMGTVPDLVQVPDLSPPPPLVCGPLFVVSVDTHGREFCDSDRDGDAVTDRLDSCPALASGQSPDPQRRGCPAPRSYQIILPAAAFAAGGNIDLRDGTATSRPDYDWAALRHAPATLSSIIFFQNGSSNVTNAVSFGLVGVADFSAPLTTLDPCAAFKDNLHQDAATRGPREVTCIPRRIDLCPVDIVSPTSRLFGEAECSDLVGRGSGYVSKALGPIKLTASVASADWRSSEPMPVAGIEVQIVMGGNVSLANFQVIATIKETLK